MNFLDHVFSSLKETFPARASEWALATILFGWGLALSSNPTLFTISPSYDGLEGLAKQSTWAWLCLLGGGLRLVFLIINGSWRRTPHLRAASAFATCFFWGQITIGMLASGTGTTGLTVYPVLLCLDLFNFFRALGDAARSDRYHNDVFRNHG